MKLYVVPVGSSCNAHCQFCITKFRKPNDGLLDISTLREALNEKQFDKIEITGGGEPSLHPRIDEIIGICAAAAPTTIYTNGSYSPGQNAPKLTGVCLSRAHQDDEENKKIMGVSYDINKFLSLKVPLKLSVILHQSGIKNQADLLNYLDWAQQFASKVVVRQIFESTAPGYEAMRLKEFVPADNILKVYPDEVLESGNRLIDYKGLPVEIEERACSCENIDPVLFADGVLKTGWE